MHTIAELEQAWIEADTAPNRRAVHRELWSEYMGSREWAVKRRAIRARAGGKCERCGAEGPVEVHHWKYIRRFRERLEDLGGLCDPCHRWLGAYSNKDPRIDPFIADLLIADLMVPLESSAR